MRYKAYGETRYNEGTTPTSYHYTGQREAEAGLYFYNARFYDPSIMMFTSPDTLVPDHYNPLDWNRYLYARGNPVRYTDSSGHCIDGLSTWACIAIVATVVLKVVDYGWTAYDAGSALVTAANANNSPEVRKEALTSAAVAVGMELIEPDELTPGLPLDDIVRHSDDIGNGLLRLVREDQIGTSQPFKLRKGEDGLSVFEGILPDEVLDAFPGNEVPNTTVTIPKNSLPPGTQIIPKLDPGLSQRLSEAHRILIRPEGWSVDRFAKALKTLVGW